MLPVQFLLNVEVENLKKQLMFQEGKLLSEVENREFLIRAMTTKPYVSRIIRSKSPTKIQQYVLLELRPLLSDLPLTFDSI